MADIRLIERTPGEWRLRGIPWEKLREGAVIDKDTYMKIYFALCKLKDYEDTGLDPLGVEDMMFYQSRTSEV